MTSISNRPVSSTPPRTPVAPVERQAPAAESQAPAEPQVDTAQLAAAARADRERSTFTPAAALRPSGRASVRTEGDNFVMEAQGQVGNRGSTPRGGRLSASGSFSANGSVRVEVPRQAATDAMRAGQLPNPAAPETWPVGTRARAEVSGQAGFNASVPAGPGRVGRELGLGASYDRSQTQRYELERTSPDTLRATVTSQGRQQDAASARGLEGRQDQRLERTQTADFNITQPEGRAAYQDFLRTGQLPRENGPGVSNVRTTDGLDQNRSGRVLGRQVATSARETNLTGDGDGNRTVRQTDRNVAGSTQSTDLRLSPDGTGQGDTRINDSVRATTTTRPGQPAETNYDLTFTDPNAARIARGAFSGDAAAMNDGSPYSVRLNESQARELLGRTLGPDMAGGQRPMDQAFRALSQRGQETFATTLFNATQNPDGSRRPFASTPAPTPVPAATQPQFEPAPSIS
ncbi:hypothetical protein [Corallococcus terminator]|uniref:Uncharacterized protein n=1 Tax=Corallococcus terminator TaxID=2316733 RepID=A0A3A8IGV8_9BACT|nr:hypothetical protein [Corallococcus terminator]RKG79020.1 hypothetical protein D7V88_29285 [Corallococcus terminator]